MKLHSFQPEAAFAAFVFGIPQITAPFRGVIFQDGWAKQETHGVI